MKRFLAVYTGSVQSTKRAAWDAMDESVRKQREQAGIAAWMEWGKTHADAILDHGAPLGRTKRAGAEGVSDIRNQMAAYVIVQAESHEAAAQMFEQHPHFTIFPGESVEIMECLPIPGS